MKCRIVAVFLVFFLVFSSQPLLADADENAVDRLIYYDLLRGTGKGMELDRTPTRIESLIMIIRLSGEEYLLDGYLKDSHPFTDIPNWAEAYVCYGYREKIITGINPNEFSPNSPVTAAQFTTMILRFLGYDDQYGIYMWDDPWEISDFIGITKKDIRLSDKFTRADMAEICYRTLGTCLNSKNTTVYSNSNRYGFIGTIDTRREGSLEFRTESKLALLIGPIELNEGGYLLVGSHASYGAGNEISTKVSEIDGRAINIRTTDSDVLEFKLGYEKYYSYSTDSEEVFYYRTLVINAKSPGKAAIVATSDGNNVQAIHIEVLPYS